MPDSSKWYRCSLAWLLIAGAMGYMVLAVWRPYWADEIWSILDARLGFRDMIESRTARGHLPVYYAILWTWRRTFGESEIALRLPAVAAVIASAALLYDLARRLGSRRVALAATALFLASPVEIGMGPQARMYSTIQCLALVSTWALLVGWVQPSRIHLWAFGAASLAGLNTHWSYGFVFVGQLIALVVMVLFRRRRSLSFLAVAMGMLAVATPWLVIAARTSMPSQNLRWLGAFRPGDIWALPVELVAGSSFDHTYLNAVAALLMVGVVAYGIRRLKWNLSKPCAQEDDREHVGSPSGRGAVVAWMFVFPLVAVALFGAAMNVNIVQTPRYVLCVLPFFWLAVATVLNAVEERSKAVSAAVLSLLIAVTVCAGARAVQPWYTECRRPAEWLTKNRLAQDAVVAVGNFDQLVPFVFYYNAPCLCLPTSDTHSLDMLQRDYPVTFLSPRDFPGKAPSGSGVWLFLTSAAADALADDAGHVVPETLRPLKAWMNQRSRRDAPPVGDGQLIYLYSP